MKELWKMWKLVRFLENHKIPLALQLIEDTASSDVGKRTLKIVRDEVQKKEDELGRKLTDNELDDLIQENLSDRDEYKKFLIYRKSWRYNNEPTVDRDDLVNLYLSHCEKGLIEKHKDLEIDERVSDKEILQKKMDINSTLESCVSDNEKDYFIKKDSEDPSHIRLTGKGKKFAGHYGLFKEFVKELGVRWAVVIALITGALGGYAAKNVLDLFNFFREKIL